MKKFWVGYDHAKKGESGKFLIGSLGHKKYEMKKDRITQTMLHKSCKQGNVGKFDIL